MQNHEWKEMRIKDLGRVVTGRTPPTAIIDYFGEEYPFITPSDMNGSKTIGTTGRKLSSKGSALLASSQVSAGSVCVSCIGWQMGKVVMTRETSFTNQQINTIVPNEEALPDFLYYSLCTRREELKTLGSVGTRTPILIKSEFEKLRVLVPPLPTQRKIAAILSAYDDLIANNTRRLALLEALAQTLYREWFVHFRFPGHAAVPLVDSPLGPIPAGWGVKKLGDVIELAYGKALKADTRREGTIPVYGSAGIVGHHDESLGNGPGIIVGRKGNVGSVFWSDEDFYPIDTVFYVRTDVPLHYVYYNLRGQHFINNDSAVPGLSRNQAYSNPFLVPAPEVLEAFERFITPLFAQLRNLTTKNANLRCTRDLLLPRLIAGAVDVAGLAINLVGEVKN